MDKATVSEILIFLRELRQNNNREWFHKNKDRYLKLKNDFEHLTEDLIREISFFDEEIKGLAPKDCIYRIYRDIRFSPDKSPYKTHFAAYICAWKGKNSERCGYYFHVEPDNCMLGGGCYCPSPALLKRLRQDIYDNIEEFTSILYEKEFAQEFPGIDPTDKLKKVPAPFPADFPQGDLLKYKHYDIVTVKSDDYFTSDDIVVKAANVFQKMYRFNRFLNYTIDESINV